jgi:hypothetical protein
LLDTTSCHCGVISMTDASHASLPSAETAEPLRLRWPIYLQLLIPTVAVVLLASLLATAITVYWIAQRVRNEQSDNLRRVGETLSKSGYPLSKPVLEQLSGYSGANFVLLTSKGRIQESTLRDRTEPAIASNASRLRWAIATISWMLSVSRIGRRLPSRRRCSFFIRKINWRLGFIRRYFRR